MADIIHYNGKPLNTSDNRAEAIKYKDTTVAEAIESQTEIVSDEWQSTKTYAIGDYCISGNKLWKCKVQNVSQTPSEGSYWTQVSIVNEMDFKKVYSNSDGSFILLSNGKLVIVICAGWTDTSGVLIPESYRPKQIFYISCCGANHSWTTKAAGYLCIYTDGTLAYQPYDGTLNSGLFSPARVIGYNGIYKI